MNRIINLVFLGLIVWIFALFNAAISDNVSQAQLDIMYNCYVVYTESEFSENCRNELDGFGHMYDRQYASRQYAALESL